jgi:hypothetical protein
MMMLLNRVKTIEAYLEAVASGAIPLNHELLRSIKAISYQIPSGPSLAEKTNLSSGGGEDLSDTALVNLLSQITMGMEKMIEVSDKFATVGPKRGGWERGGSPTFAMED